MGLGALKRSPLEAFTLVFSKFIRQSSIVLSRYYICVFPKQNLYRQLFDILFFPGKVCVSQAILPYFIGTYIVYIYRDILSKYLYKVG